MSAGGFSLTRVERERLLLIARNFVQAYTELMQRADERERYLGYDPRNHKGAQTDAAKRR